MFPLVSCFKMLLCMAMLLFNWGLDGSISPIAVNALSFSEKSISSAALQTTSSVAHVMEHLLSPPSALLQSSTSLEDLTNVRIPSLKETGVEILAHVATPSNWDEPINNKSKSKDLNVLIIIHEFFGLTDSIVDKANGLAEELGCVVIAPDTFRGTTTTFIPKAIWLALSTPQDRVNDDLDAICSYVESGFLGDFGGSGGAAEAEKSTDSTETTCKFAILGFCYGGGKAIRYTTQRRQDAATVVFYGMPVTDTQELQKLESPVCGIYGRNDVQFPMPLLEEFQSALATANVEEDVKIYDGVGHAFWKNMEEICRGDQPQQQAFQQCTGFLKEFFDSGS